MGDYLASLELIKARKFNVLWPTHGPPIREVTPFIDAYIAHRRDRERQILAQLAAGETTIKAMVPKIYAAVDSRLWPAAAHSVLAQMIELVRTGQGRFGWAAGYRQRLSPGALARAGRALAAGKA